MFDYDRLALDVAQEFSGSGLFRLNSTQSPQSRKLQNYEGVKAGTGELHASDMFDCGSSSGYGSPGAAGTPLASPAPNSDSFLSESVQKMLLDHDLYEELQRSASYSLSNTGGLLNTTDIGQLISGMTIDQVDDSVKRVESVGLSTSSSQVSNASTFSPNPLKTENSTATPVAVEDGFSPDEIAQFAELLASPKKTPPSRYQCHICYNTGHYISDCPMRFNSPYEELTPYQGRKKCYGEFTCQVCKRRWTSQNSVANEAQSCIKCHVPVFPHKQLPVDKAVALGLVKAQRTVPSKVAPIGHGRPPFPTAVRP